MHMCIWACFLLAACDLYHLIVLPWEVHRKVCLCIAFFHLLFFFHPWKEFFWGLHPALILKFFLWIRNQPGLEFLFFLLLVLFINILFKMGCECQLQLWPTLPSASVLITLLVWLDMVQGHFHSLCQSFLTVAFFTFSIWKYGISFFSFLSYHGPI